MKKVPIWKSKMLTLCLADSSEKVSTYPTTNDPQRDFIVQLSRLIKDAFFSQF